MQNRQIRDAFLLAALLVGGCAKGIDPPAPTRPVPISGGTFTMGGTEVDPCDKSRVTTSGVATFSCDAAIASEVLQHQVAVNAFCIDEHEVTIDQYRHCVARGKCEKPKITNAGNPGKPGHIEKYYTKPDKYGDYPVLGVTWQQARNYCAFHEGRLPTEVEWEYAARSGGTDRTTVWSQANVIEECRNEEEVAFGECSGRSVLPVMIASQDIAKVKVDGSGNCVTCVHDLAGNAQEWVLDDYDMLAYCDEDQNGRPPLEAYDTTRQNVFPTPKSGTLDALYTSGSAADGCPTCDAQHSQCIEACRKGFGGDDPSDTERNRWLRYDCALSNGLNSPDACDVADNRPMECGSYDTCITNDAQRARRPIDDSACLERCIVSYGGCARSSDCTKEGVGFACVNVGRPDDPILGPRPVCFVRGYQSGTAPVVDAAHTVKDVEALAGYHVVRGANFEEQEACDVRVTRRGGKNQHSPLVGFRCAYDDNTPRCRVP